MADFQFYLNRQGIRGLQGVKGDQGDSPIITVQTETPNEYILKITNPDGTELISPNLRGNKININEGTYVRYNTETGELYTSTADGATGELAGVVRLATDADITNMDERAAVTPSQLADALSQYLVSPDGSVKIVQNAESSLTELTAEKGLTELPIASASTLGAVKIGENLSITEDGTLTASTAGTTDYTQLENKPQINSVELTGNKTLDDLGIQAKGNYLTALPDNAVTTDTTQTITGSKTFTRGINATDIYPSGIINFSGTFGAINSCKQIAGGYGAGSYIDLSDMMDIRGRNSLTLEGGTGGLKLAAASSSSITCENTLIAPEIRTTTNKKYLTEEDVDNQTIQIVEGKLHANLDELGNEVNSLSGEVTSLSGEVTDLSGRVTAAEADLLKKQNKLVQGDNITLTNNEDGTTTIAAESTVPTNMVTTDTEQVIPSIKLFRHPVYDNGFTQIQGASISLLRYDREEVGRIDMGSSSNGIAFYCAGQDNMVFQMGGTSTRYFDFLASSGNIMNRMRYYGSGNYYDIFNAGNLIPSSNITISEASDTGVHTIDISQALLNRITILETTVASLQTQIGEISAQLDTINGEVI